MIDPFTLYKTRTLTERIATYGEIKGLQLFAIDIGYGQVKVQAETARSIFPAYVKEITSLQDQDFGKVSRNYIRIEDHKSGRRFLVGESAMDSLSDGISDAREALYSNMRYSTDAYKVLVMASLGRCSMLSCAHPASDKNIYIETGLPSNQMQKDQKDRREAIRKAFEGDYDFTIVFGPSDPHRFTHTIYKENIDVLKQPNGTLFHLCTNDHFTYAKESCDILMAPDAKILMIDAGTKTVILTKKQMNSLSHIITLDDCGMARILKLTSDYVYSDTGYKPTDIELQVAFGAGTLLEYDPETFETKEIDIKPYVERATKEAFEKVVSDIRKFVPDLGTYKVIILTGGTSAAWEPLFREKFSKIRGLTFMMGNTCYYADPNHPGANYKNNSMQIAFANVSGYFKYLHMSKTEKR